MKRLDESLSLRSSNLKIDARKIMISSSGELQLRGNMNYNYLILDDKGEFLLGVERSECPSYATLDSSGSHGAINPSEIVLRQSIKPSKVMLNRQKEIIDELEGLCPNCGAYVR